MNATNKQEFLSHVVAIRLTSEVAYSRFASFQGLARVVFICWDRAMEVFGADGLVRIRVYDNSVIGARSIRRDETLPPIDPRRILIFETLTPSGIWEVRYQPIRSMGQAVETILPNPYLPSVKTIGEAGAAQRYHMVLK